MSTKFKVPAIKPRAINNEDLSMPKVLSRLALAFTSEQIFHALTGGFTDEERENLIEENPNIVQETAQSWCIFRQRQTIGAVPCQVTHVELTLEEDSNQVRKVFANVFGHNLKFSFQETEEGGAQLPDLSNDGKFVFINSNDQEVGDDAEPVRLMSLAIRKSQQGGLNDIWRIEPRNQSGSGAVINRTVGKPRIDESGNQLAPKTRWDLDKSSIPGLMALLIAVCSGSDPEVVELLSKAEEDSTNMTAIANALNKVVSATESALDNQGAAGLDEDN